VLSGRTDLTAYRLFHGDAEGVPGLAIDRYGEVVVVHADSAALLERWLPDVRTDLADFGTAYARIHPRTTTRLTTDDVRQLAPEAPVWGAPVFDVDVLENGVRYVVRPDAGLSVGLFLDMREVRGWLRANSAQRRVLNLFAYTCSFGVNAVLGAASRVLNLDLSRGYLDWGKANYRLNGLPVDDRDFVYGDALDWLGRFGRRGERFDVVIVDPPSFSSTPFSVTRDYPRLAEAAARTVTPAGILLAATNHAGTSDDRFDDWLQHGLSLAGRLGRVVQRWHAPRLDFPQPPGRGHPYLKVRALVLD
jgi:23S rRNA (cytosine1962-C5)-methyltransferase